MASGFSDLSLGNSEQTKVKLPKGFGASDAVGTVVELVTNNRLGDSSIYLEMFDKKGSAEVKTKKTVKNFLNYVKEEIYNDTIFHRLVPGFVLQGGGYSAPSVPAAEGGTVEPISPFETIKNQPGNSNLRGTVAMAKLAGDPDSASSQWFINLADNVSLDEQNDGFTVFGNVLGDGINIVDQLSSAEVYDFTGVFADLPLWELDNEGDSGLQIQPEDFVIAESVRKLKSKNQPYALTVESSNADLVDVSVGNKQKVKLSTSSDLSGTAEVSVVAVSLIDGTTYEDSFDVIVGSASADSSLADQKRIDVFVDAGSFENPYYRFFDANGKEFDDFKINVKKKYRFLRLGGSESHPFYVSDSGYNEDSTDAVKIKGDGSFSDGITGLDALKFHVRKSARETFKQEGKLFFYCTSHPSMIGSFSIKGQKSVQPFEPVQEMVMEPVNSDPVGNDSSGYYRIAMDSTDHLPLI